IEFQIHSSPGFCGLQVRILECVRNYCDGKNSGTLERRDCQTDAVDRNGTFFNDIAGFGLRKFYLQIPFVTLAVEAADTSDPIYMTLHNVAAKTGIRPHRPLQIYKRARLQAPETASIQSLA